MPRAGLVAFHPGFRGGGRFDTVLLVAALREQLKRLQQVHDDVVIDTPPGTSWPTLAAVAVADVLITPVPGEMGAQLGLDRLRVTIHNELTGLLKPRLHRWCIAPVRFDHRRTLDHEILERLRKRYPHRMTSPVRDSQVVKQAFDHAMPVSLHAPDSEAVIAPSVSRTT